MGLFDKLKSTFMEEVPDATPAPKQAAQPVAPLVTNTNFQQQQAPINTTGVTENMFAPAPAQPAISEEDKKKWQEYFNKLYSKAKITCPEYSEFLNNIETVVETDSTLPEANKFKMAFSFMKKKGVTKEQLMAALTNALGVVDTDRTTAFAKDINDKTANMENNIKLIEDKKLAIQKLSEEINQLQTDTETIKNKIATKTYFYNIFSSQLLAKIKNDVAGITNYIN